MLQKQASAGLFLLVASLTGGCQAQLKDGCKMETLRRCGDDYIPFGNGISFPESGKLFTDRDELRQIECGLKFVDDCLKGVPKTAAFLTLNSIKEYTESVCAVGTKDHEGLRKVIGCMNSVGTKMHACMRVLKEDLQRAIVKAPTKDVIPHACCSYGTAEDCVHQVLAPCKEVGADEYATAVLKQVFGRTLELVCDKYAGNSDACKSLPTLPELGPNDPKAENYVELLIRAANTIGHRN
ncbi:hypothetical protein MTO96_025276 [Rhipicephalus appendiculatus]